jgi:hypothetical protein
VSAHGFGHSLRTANLLERVLRVIPCELDVCSAASPQTWPAAVRAHVRQWSCEPCDIGVLQAGELVVDRGATERALEDWQRFYPARVDDERHRLAGTAAAVLGDVPPLAFDAAAEAGVPSFALANFSWDWVYRSLGFGAAAAEAERAYARAGLLFELTPAAPMPAFRSRVPVGVLGRRAEVARHHTRARLGLQPQQRLVLAAFRSPSSWRLPAPSFDVRFVHCDGSHQERDDVLPVPPGIAFADLLAAADAVVAKTGYGIIADAVATGTPFLYTTRAGFPEDEVLASWLAAFPWTRAVSRERLVAGCWTEELDQILCVERPDPQPADDVGRAVDAMRPALCG